MMVETKNRAKKESDYWTQAVKKHTTIKLIGSNVALCIINTLKLYEVNIYKCFPAHN